MINLVVQIMCVWVRWDYWIAQRFVSSHSFSRTYFWWRCNIFCKVHFV